MSEKQMRRAGDQKQTINVAVLMVILGIIAFWASVLIIGSALFGGVS